MKQVKDAAQMRQLLLNCLAERLVKLDVANVEDERVEVGDWFYEVEAVRVGDRIVVHDAFYVSESNFFKLKNQKN